MPSINAADCVQSAVAPAVTATLTGIPCASTPKGILLLSPLLYAPFPDCRLWLLPHERVYLAVAGINHQPFKAGLVNQHFKLQDVPAFSFLREVKLPHTMTRHP
jgi:hypothetical protein